jgi:hypothetical protein
MARSRPRVLSCRLTCDEYTALEAASRRSGASMSALLRDRLADLLRAAGSGAPSFIPEPGRAAA